MAFCSNCGSPIAGAKRFCSKCGFKVDDVPQAPDRSEVMEAEVVDEGGPAHPPGDQTCVECDDITEQKCYFCWANICIKHTKRMQIFINKAPFGNVVVSCRKCADEKHDHQPTQSEAEGAALFFGVKPYHTWKVVK